MTTPVGGAMDATLRTVVCACAPAVTDISRAASTAAEPCLSRVALTKDESWEKADVANDMSSTRVLDSLLVVIRIRIRNKYYNRILLVAPYPKGFQ